MKVVHLCVSCFYIDGHRYQENELVRQHVSAGHDVLVVASTENYGPDGRLVWGPPREYRGSDDAPVKRLPYVGPFPFFIKKKLRIHRGIYSLLEQHQPDVIMFHGLCGWELRTAARYKRNHPHVKLYVDSHEDAYNSGLNFLSRYVLHGMYYKWIIQSSLDAIDKILCVTPETMDFVRDMYGVPPDMLEFYPLGGIVASDEIYAAKRAAARRALGYDENNVVFVQSGRFNHLKRLDESLKAFSDTSNPNFRFLIVGKLMEGSNAERVQELIERDRRIAFIGWKSADELYDILCGADLYVQPGPSQSVTMQMSLCTRCPVILFDLPSHGPFVRGNGWKVTDQESTRAAFREIEQNPDLLKRMSLVSLRIASEMLDYQKLADRLVQ